MTIKFPIKIDTVFDFRDFPHSGLIGIDEVSQKVFDRYECEMRCVYFQHPIPRIPNPISNQKFPLHPTAKFITF